MLGLDGVPWSFLARAIAEGRLPRLGEILRRGALKRMTSTLPYVSSVAWASFMTGKNPGAHGIYGFIDRRPGSYKTFIPTTRHLRSETLWEILSHHGRRVVVMNVPLSYPPREVNGILVGCFLSPRLEKATHPPEVAGRLAAMGYRIDADAKLAHQDLVRFLEDLHHVLAKRIEAFRAFIAEEPWDFFMGHIMETDRLHHFLWRQMEEGPEHDRRAFYTFYQELDRLVGEIWEDVEGRATRILLSDHGFCSVKQEVHLNAWLRAEGWLAFDRDPPESLEDLSARTRAYSLEPGRIFIHVAGREPRGSVRPGLEYERAREELAQALSELRDPETGEKTVRSVFRREELYHGPCISEAPDLILLPEDGYDFKAGVRAASLTARSALTGVHTYDDAFLFVEGRSVTREDVTIADAMPSILHLMSVPIPPDVDGRVVLSA